MLCVQSWSFKQVVYFNFGHRCVILPKESLIRLLLIFYNASNLLVNYAMGRGLRGRSGGVGSVPPTPLSLFPVWSIGPPAHFREGKNGVEYGR